MSVNSQSCEILNPSIIRFSRSATRQASIYSSPRTARHGPGPSKNGTLGAGDVTWHAHVSMSRWNTSFVCGPFWPLRRGPGAVWGLLAGESRQSWGKLRDASGTAIEPRNQRCTVPKGDGLRRRDRRACGPPGRESVNSQLRHCRTRQFWLMMPSLHGRWRAVMLFLPLRGSVEFCQA